MKNLRNLFDAQQATIIGEINGIFIEDGEDVGVEFAEENTEGRVCEKICLMTAYENAMHIAYDKAFMNFQLLDIDDTPKAKLFAKRQAEAMKLLLLVTVYRRLSEVAYQYDFLLFTNGFVFGCKK